MPGSAKIFVWKKRTSVQECTESVAAATQGIDDKLFDPMKEAGGVINTDGFSDKI